MPFQVGPRLMGNRVCTVLVTWNSSAVLPGTLGALLDQGSGDLVVIDNGSSDDSIQVVRRMAPHARIVAQAHNSGFAAACNIGIRLARSPYVLLLNDDAVLGPGYVTTLIKVLDREPRAASAVGKLLWDVEGPQRIDSAGITLRRCALSPEDRGHGEVDHGQYDVGCEVFGASAAAALFRRAALDGLGPNPFDEDLFAYYEDVDLAWRLSRRGWKHLYEPRVQARHMRRGPALKPPKIAARAFANRYLVWLKNESLWRFATYAPLAIGWEAARISKRLLKERHLLTGLPGAARLIPRFLRKRREERHATRDPVDGLHGAAGGGSNSPDSARHS